MSTRTVHLPDHFNRFIDETIISGRFTDANEVVSEGLRLLEQRQREDDAKLEWLHAAIEEGFHEIDRGEGIAFESMDHLDAHLRNLTEEVVAEYAADRKHG